LRPPSATRTIATTAATISCSSRLDQELRLTILRLKDHWHREPSYPETVGGFEIYDAVLNHGVRTLEELDHYLSERALPPRVL